MLLTGWLTGLREQLRWWNLVRWMRQRQLRRVRRSLRRRSARTVPAQLQALERRQLLSGTAPVFDGNTVATSLPENETPQVLGSVHATADDGQPVSYAIVDDGYGGTSLPFAIDPDTGAVATTQPLNYEQQAYYSFQVMATDDQDNSSTLWIGVSVGDVNEAPHFTNADSTWQNWDYSLNQTIEQASYSVSLNENQSAGTAVVNLNARRFGGTSDDSGLTYSLLDNGYGSGPFAINATSGVMTTTAALDYETQNSYSLLVQVTDASGNLSRASIQVGVQNIDETPHFTNADSTWQNWDSNLQQYVDQAYYSLTQPEDILSGTTIATLQATGYQNAAVQFSLTSDNGTVPFAINATTGVLTTTGLLDYQAQSYYSLRIQATDAHGNANWANVSIGLTSVDKRPQFTNPTSSWTGWDSSLNQNVTQASYSASLPEDTANGTTVFDVDALGYINAHDPNATAPTLSYSLVDSGYGIGPFAINATTGVITTTGALDYETTPSFAFRVAVNDGRGHSNQADVSLSIGNIDETPQFTNADGTSSNWNSDLQQNVTEGYYSRSVAETTLTGTTVLTVAATGYLNHAVTYSLVDTGSGSVPFAINATTGVISTTGPLDAQSQSYYSLRIRAIDAAGNANWANISLGVISVDQRPQFTNPTSSWTGWDYSLNQNVTQASYSGELAENQPANTVLFDIDAEGFVNPDDPNATAPTLSYSLVDSGYGIGPFAINPATGVVTTTAPLDYETTPSYSFRVQVSDGHGHSNQADISLSVDDVNEHPHFTNADSTGMTWDSSLGQTIEQASYSVNVDENQSSGTTVVNLNARRYGATSDDSGLTYSLLDDGNGPFAINPATGVVTTTAPLDFEAAYGYSLLVEVADGGNVSRANVWVNVQNVDETPQFTNADGTASGWNPDLQQYVDQAVYNVTIGDNATTVLTLQAAGYQNAVVHYSLTSDNGDVPLTVNATTGVITVTDTLDHESQSYYSLRVQATDTAGNRNWATVNIAVTAAPPDVSDPDNLLANSGFETSLVAGENSWSYVPTTQPTQLANFLPNWTVSATGAYNVILNHGVSAYNNPAPADGNQCLGLQSGETAPVSLSQTVSLAADSSITLSAAMAMRNMGWSANWQFTVEAFLNGVSLGEQTVANSGTWQDYTWTAAASAGDNTITFRCASQQAGDRTLFLDHVRLVAVATESSPATPVLSGAEAVQYLLNQPATPVNPALTISDADDSTLAFATVTLTNVFTADDVLGFTNDGQSMGNITGSYDPVSGVLTLTSANATATVAEFQAALRAVTYRNKSTTPNTAPRFADFQVNDGMLASNIVTSTITMTTDQNAPVLTGLSANHYVLNQPAIVVNPTLTIADRDSETLFKATVILTNCVATNDVLAFTNDGATMGNLTGSFNPSTGALLLTSPDNSATLAEYQAALRSVTYRNQSTTPNTYPRFAAFQVNDGELVSNIVTTITTMATDPEAPVLAGQTSNNYVLNQPGVAINPTLSISSTVSATLVSATVALTNFVTADDVLSFVNDGQTMGNLVGTLNSSHNTLTLTSPDGSATIEDFQAALRAVTYRNKNNSPNTSPRFAAFLVNDGTFASNIVTTITSLAPDAAAPVLSGTSAASFNMYDAPVSINSAITVTVAAGANIVSATVTLTNFVSADDRLGFTNDGLTMGNLVGTWNSSHDTLTLTSPDNSAANAEFQAALRGVTYENQGANPNLASRSVAFQVFDGTLYSNRLISSLTLTNTNHPPTQLTLSPAEIAENQPLDTTVGTFTTTDPDTNDTASYSLDSGDADNANFWIDADGTLKTNAVFDYESRTSYSIRVRSTDHSGLSIEQTFTIQVANFNEAPNSLTLSNNSVAENQPLDTTVGTFTTTDPDTNDTASYSLVSGNGAADNSSFWIDTDGTLKTNAVFDYESRTSYSIRVRSVDRGGLSIEQAFTIHVSDVVDAPTVTQLNFQQSGNELSGTLTGSFLGALQPDWRAIAEIDLNNDGVADRTAPVSDGTFSGELTFASPSGVVQTRIVEFDPQSTASLTGAWKSETVQLNRNHPPEFGQAHYAFTISPNSTGVSGTVQATDGDSDALTYRLQGTDDFTINATTGALSVVADRQHPSGQVYSFRVYAADGVSEAVADVAITVAQPTGPTVVTQADVATTDSRQTATFDVLANDSSTAGPLTLARVGASSLGTIAVRHNELVFIPNGQLGSEDLVYTVVGGDGTLASGTLHLTVNRPVLQAVADPLSTIESTPLVIMPLRNDRLSAASTYTLSWSTPAHGGVEADSSDSQQLIYTPNAGFLGTETFNYTVTDDAGESSTATITIIVAPPPPLAIDDAISLYPGDTQTLDLLANDSDPRQQTFVVTAVTQPASGTLTWDVGTGGAIENLRYTPAAGFLGFDQFEYTITNAAGATATAIADLQVIPRPAPRLTDLGLWNDSAVAGDLRTSDPRVTGHVESKLPDSQIRIQFDVNGDGVIDVSAPLNAAADRSFVADLSANIAVGAIHLSARIAEVDSSGAVQAVGSWETLDFTYTAEGDDAPPTPPAADPDAPTLLNAEVVLATVAAVEIQGSVQSADGGTSPAVEFDFNGDGVADFQADVIAGNFDQTFTDQFGSGVTIVNVRPRDIDPVTDQVRLGSWTSVDVNRPYPANIPASIVAVNLKNDTGTAGDGITRDATLVGTVSNPDGPLSNVWVELDTNGDGVADQDARVTDAGTFEIAPQNLSAGNLSLQLRARDYDAHTDSWSEGAWVPFSLTYTPLNLTPIDVTNLAFDATGANSDSQPAITGQLSADPQQFSTLVVQIDTNGDGIADGEVTEFSGDQHAFRWTVPADKLPAGSATFSVRTVGRDLENGNTLATVPGDWVDLSFSYVAPAAPSSTVSGLHLVDESGATVSSASTVVKIAGTIDSQSQAVQYDLDGDWFADGTIAADPNGQFVADLTNRFLQTGSLTVRFRALRTTGGQSEFGDWQAFTFLLTPPTVASSTVSNLSILTSDGTPRGISGTVTGPARQVEYDLNGDGVADGVVNTDALGSGNFVASFDPQAFTGGQIAIRAVPVAGQTSSSTNSWQTVTATTDGSSSGNSAPPALSNTTPAPPPPASANSAGFYQLPLSGTAGFLFDLSDTAYPHEVKPYDRHGLLYINSAGYLTEQRNGPTRTIHESLPIDSVVTIPLNATDSKTIARHSTWEFTSEWIIDAATTDWEWNVTLTAGYSLTTVTNSPTADQASFLKQSGSYTVTIHARGHGENAVYSAKETQSDSYQFNAGCTADPAVDDNQTPFYSQVGQRGYEVKAAGYHKQDDDGLSADHLHDADPVFEIPFNELAGGTISKYAYNGSTWSQINQGDEHSTHDIYLRTMTTPLDGPASPSTTFDGYTTLVTHGDFKTADIHPYDLATDDVATNSHELAGVTTTKSTNDHYTLTGTDSHLTESVSDVVNYPSRLPEDLVDSTVTNTEEWHVHNLSTEKFDRSITQDDQSQAGAETETSSTAKGTTSRNFDYDYTESKTHTHSKAGSDTYAGTFKGSNLSKYLTLSTETESGSGSDETAGASFTVSGEQQEFGDGNSKTTTEGTFGDSGTVTHNTLYDYQRSTGNWTDTSSSDLDHDGQTGHSDAKEFGMNQDVRVISSAETIDHGTSTSNGMLSHSGVSFGTREEHHAGSTTIDTQSANSLVTSSVLKTDGWSNQRKSNFDSLVSGTGTITNGVVDYTETTTGHENGTFGSAQSGSGTSSNKNLAITDKSITTTSSDSYSTSKSGKFHDESLTTVHQLGEDQSVSASSDHNESGTFIWENQGASQVITATKAGGGVLSISTVGSDADDSGTGKFSDVSHAEETTGTSPSENSSASSETSTESRDGQSQTNAWNDLDESTPVPYFDSSLGKTTDSSNQVTNHNHTETDYQSNATDSATAVNHVVSTQSHADSTSSGTSTAIETLVQATASEIHPPTRPEFTETTTSSASYQKTTTGKSAATETSDAATACGDLLSSTSTAQSTSQSDSTWTRTSASTDKQTGNYLTAGEMEYLTDSSDDKTATTKHSLSAAGHGHDEESVAEWSKQLFGLPLQFQKNDTAHGSDTTTLNTATDSYDLDETLENPVGHPYGTEAHFVINNSTTDSLEHPAVETYQISSQTAAGPGHVDNLSSQSETAEVSDKTVAKAHEYRRWDLPSQYDSELTDHDETTNDSKSTTNSVTSSFSDERHAPGYSYTDDSADSAQTVSDSSSSSKHDQLENRPSGDYVHDVTSKGSSGTSSSSDSSDERLLDSPNLYAKAETSHHTESSQSNDTSQQTHGFRKTEVTAGVTSVTTGNSTVTSKDPNAVKFAFEDIFVLQSAANGPQQLTDIEIASDDGQQSWTESDTADVTLSGKLASTTFAPKDATVTGKSHQAKNVRGTNTYHDDEDFTTRKADLDLSSSPTIVDGEAHSTSRGSSTTLTNINGNRSATFDSSKTGQTTSDYRGRSVATVSYNDSQTGESKATQTWNNSDDEEDLQSTRVETTHEILGSNSKSWSYQDSDSKTGGPSGNGTWSTKTDRYRDQDDNKTSNADLTTITVTDPDGTPPSVVYFGTGSSNGKSRDDKHGEMTDTTTWKESLPYGNRQKTDGYLQHTQKHTAENDGNLNTTDNKAFTLSIDGTPAWSGSHTDKHDNTSNSTSRDEIKQDFTPTVVTQPNFKQTTSDSRTRFTANETKQETHDNEASTYNSNGTLTLQNAYDQFSDTDPVKYARVLNYGGDESTKTVTSTDSRNSGITTYLTETTTTGPLQLTGSGGDPGKNSFEVTAFKNNAFTQTDYLNGNGSVATDDRLTEKTTNTDFSSDHLVTTSNNFSTAGDTYTGQLVNGQVPLHTDENDDLFTQTGTESKTNTTYTSKDVVWGIITDAFNGTASLMSSSYGPFYNANDKLTSEFNWSSSDTINRNAVATEKTTGAISKLESTSNNSEDVQFNSNWSRDQTVTKPSDSTGTSFTATNESDGTDVVTGSFTNSTKLNSTTDRTDPENPVTTEAATVTSSGNLTVDRQSHSKGSVSATWPGPDNTSETGGSDWDINDDFGYGASYSSSQTGTSDSDYQSAFPDVRDVVTYHAQNTGVVHSGDLPLAAHFLFNLWFSSNTIVPAATHNYDGNWVYWLNGNPPTNATTHLYAIMKWGDGDAWYTDLRTQVAQFAPITRINDTPTPLPIDWQGMARDAALNTIFPGYQLFMDLKDAYSSYFPSDDQYKDNYFDTYLPEENGFNADQRAGQFDGFLNRINPLDSLVSFPDIGMNHGHQDAYDTGKAQGEFAGTVAITVASFASGVFSCGTLGNTAMAVFEFASVAGDLKAAHDSFQKGDVAGGAMNLFSAGLNILSLRNTMSQCFTGSTQFCTPTGVKRVRDFQDQDRLDTRTELDPNAPITVGWVSKVFVGWAQIFELEVNGRLIETTAEHRFQLKNEGWVPAKELLPGDLIASDNPEVWLPVQRAELTTRFDTVYNVRVANDHTYFVGGEDWGFSVWAHNNYNTAKINAKEGDVGSFSSLRGKGVVGDGLTPHHMPQAALGFTGYGEGGALMLKFANHLLTRTFGIKGKITAAQDATLPFRVVLAKDINDIRKIFGSKLNGELKGLIQFYTENFPELIAK